MNRNDLTLEEILRRWSSVGMRITPLEGKPGYWHLFEQSPFNVADSLDVEVTEDEIIAIYRAMGKGGVTWDDIRAGRYRNTGPSPRDEGHHG
jgi:hypothetical protein